MVDFAPEVSAPADAAARPSTRRYYVLGLLTVVYALNFLDRTVFNVLIEPIKKEFTLSDTTMGLLAGFGFVLFYSALGIPIARVADRRVAVVFRHRSETVLEGQVCNMLLDSPGYEFTQHGCWAVDVDRLVLARQVECARHQLMALSMSVMWMPAMAYGFALESSISTRGP